MRHNLLRDLIILAAAGAACVGAGVAFVPLRSSAFFMGSLAILTVAALVATAYCRVLTIKLVALTGAAFGFSLFLGEAVLSLFDPCLSG